MADEKSLLQQLLGGVATAGLGAGLGSLLPGRQQQAYSEEFLQTARTAEQQREQRRQRRQQFALQLTQSNPQAFAQMSPEDQSAVTEPLLEMGIPKTALNQLLTQQQPEGIPLGQFPGLAGALPPEALPELVSRTPGLGGIQIPEPEQDVIPANTVLNYGRHYTPETFGEFVEKWNAGDKEGANQVKLKLRPSTGGRESPRREAARRAIAKIDAGIPPNADEMVAYMNELGVDSGALSPTAILNAKINLAGFANTLALLDGPEASKEFLNNADVLLKEAIDTTQKISRGEATMPTGEKLVMDQGTSEQGLMKVLRIRTAVNALGPIPGPASPEVVQSAVQRLTHLGFTRAEIKAAMIEAWNIEPE